MRNISKAGIESISIIEQLASEAWTITYKNIISKEQIDFMFTMMYSEASLKKQISEGHIFFICQDDNVPTGFASCSPKDNILNTWQLHKLYVLPQLQKQGTGSELISKVYEEAKNKGAQSLELNVNRQNSAFTFYKKLGFVVSKEVDIDIGGGFFMNDYIMSKAL